MLLVPALARDQTGTPQPAGPSVRADMQPTRVRHLDVAWRCLVDVTMVAWDADASMGDDTDGWSIQTQ